jgi:ABC-2 type transport system ATP-binding protein
MLCGILTPTSGAGTVGGFDIMSQQEEIKQNIGYMSQKFSLYDDLTVEENVDFYSGIYKIPRQNRQQRKAQIIKMAGLEEFSKNLTRTLSGGWKQRLALGCAIIHDPKIIFLDEPTSGVDPITRANFWAIIKEMAHRGVTVFVTTHYMDEAENCNRMTLIYKGTMIAIGTPQEMKTKIMKDEVLEVIMPNAEDWVDKVAAVGGIKEAALFSTKIHAVTDDAQSAIPAIKELCAKEGITTCDVRKIVPSLEDVFVSSIENYDKEHPQK